MFYSFLFTIGAKKSLEVVAQAFQPVRINEAGEMPAYQSFHNLLKVHRPHE
jgi:hypothetical protein